MQAPTGLNDKDDRALRLRVLNLAPQEDVNEVFKFEAFYLGFQIYYLVLQNFHVFYFHYEYLDVSQIAWSICMVCKRIVISGFALFSLQQFGRSQRPATLRDTILFFISLAATVSLFVNLVVYALLSIAWRVYPTFVFMFILIALYFTLFGRTAWPFLKPSDPSQRIASALKGLVYSCVEAVIVIAIMPYATVSDFQRDYVIHWDWYRLHFTTVFAALSLALLLTCQLMSTHFVEYLIRARVLGYWRPIRDVQSSDRNSLPEFKSIALPVARGVRVRHRGRVFESVTQYQTGEPGDWLSATLFRLLRNPERTFGAFVLMQTALCGTAFILFVLFCRRFWPLYAIGLLLQYVACYWSITARREIAFAVRTLPPELMIR